VDQRTDIYALGCVAYWMLTARYVFNATSAIQLMARHIQTPPEPPSRHSGFPISPDLEQVVLDCLAKRPSDRPANARELCDRLDQCEATSPWTRDDARRWWETRLEPERVVSLT
jgi:serine/threonine-protein kinase